jgi:hypothetical protein
MSRVPILVCEAKAIVRKSKCYYSCLDQSQLSHSWRDMEISDTIKDLIQLAYLAYAENILENDGGLS